MQEGATGNELVNEVLGALEAMTSHPEIAKSICEVVRDMLEASLVGKEESPPEDSDVEDEEDNTEVEEEDDDDDEDDDEEKRKGEEEEGEPKYPPMDR